MGLFGSKGSDTVTVEHKYEGCPLCGRVDKHTHAVEEWNKSFREDKR
jgi:hypothetical protein